jgi:hypothetical protein
MCGKNFSLFSMYFGANSVPSTSRPTSFARSMIFRCPSSSKKPGVAGHEPAVGRDRFGRGVGPAVVLLEHAGRSHQHLAAVGDPDLHAGQRLADGVELHLPVGCLQT